MVTVKAMLLALATASAGDTELLEFSAEWCGPCKLIEPTVRRLESEGYPIRRVDVDQQPQLAARYAITAVPSFVLVRNGKEVNRIVGAATYDRLVQLFGKPHRPAERTIVRAQSPDAKPTTGTPATLAAPAPAVHRTPAAPTATAAQLPTANVAQAQPANSAVQNDPSAALNSTVRLRIEDAEGHSVGTGTVIDTHGAEALIITCGHIFRDSNGKGKISVDLFTDGRKDSSVDGNLISFDLDRDIALVSIMPGRPMNAFPIAPAGYQLRAGSPVYSIGCDKGDDPSVRPSQITALDKYMGPPNIEVAGQPVDGRSGGGLFSADGFLIGICNAADPADDEGIYAALATIHWGLDQIGQQRIYEATALAATQSGNNPSGDAVELPQAMPKSMPETSVPVAAMATPDAAPSAGAPAPIGGATETLASNLPTQQIAADTEVICIVRSRSNPGQSERLLILDQPSQDLLERLRTESRSTNGVASPLAQQTIPVNSRQPVVRAQSAN